MSKLIAASLVLILASLPCCQHEPKQRTADQSVVEHCETAEDIAVRFWYLPPNTDSTPGPLILLPASSQDPRLDTRPAWVLYVSLSDLHSVVRVLAQSRLEWRESSAAKQLVVDPFQLPRLDRQTMEIAMSYPNRSAKTELKAERICPLLSRAYGALVSPKARETMAFWTGNVGCVMKLYQSSAPPK
jgi:hypothetical protein